MLRFVSILLLSLIPARSFVCACFFPIDDKGLNNWKKGAEIIFYGTILKNKNSTDGAYETVGKEIKYTVKVVKVWKGRIEGIEELILPSSDCGTFKDGENYIFSARRDPNTNLLSFSFCGCISEETKPDPYKENETIQRNRDGFRKVISFLNEDSVK